ncbi:hypothetical protein [Acaryochloris sp. 'Moss Beach']|uniref:hypothetical protein n=1 Tax=Acaryochloris sp. 'Moss Beach' TaxID=2740837 RepID=UPI001F3EDC4D|nr:hypothetical protein [Acaryochloris sp. 'Moss Beach']
MKLRKRSVVARFFRQTRTRILLLYVSLLGVFTGLAIPLYQTLITNQVSLRVRNDLSEAQEIFHDAYMNWERQPNQTLEDLESFADDFLANQLPEDDNFFIFYYWWRLLPFQSISITQADATGV